MSNPLNPTVATLVKLGSALIHAEELLSLDAHPYDREAFAALMCDPEVRVWIQEMDALSLLPVKRNHREDQP